MSRFFGAAESASESEDSYEENRPNVVENKFVDYDSSSEDEDKREVKTEKQKRYDDLHAVIKSMKTAMRKDDWNSVSDYFDKFRKNIDKAKRVFAKEGGVPSFVTIQMAFLKKTVEDKKALAKANKLKMSKTNSKSLNKLVQRVTKECRLYQKDIDSLEKKGELKFDSLAPVVEKDSDDSDSEAEDVEEKAKAPATTVADDAADDDSGDVGDKKTGEPAGDDFSDWSDDDDADGSGSDSDSSDVDIEVGAGGITRDFWLKKTGPADGATKKKRERGERKKVEKKKEVKKDEKGEMNAEAVLKKLRDIEEKRGRRGIDKKAYIEDLKLLLTKAKKEATRLKIMTLLATALFDISLNTGRSMPVPLWKECSKMVESIVDTLTSNRELQLTEDEEVDENYEELELEDEMKEKEAADKKNGQDEKSRPEIVYIRGNLFSFISRLSAQLTQSLQEVDEHDVSYVQRLTDEPVLVALVEKVSKYYEAIEKKDFLVKVQLINLSHIYYTYKKDLDVFKDSKEEASGYLMTAKPLFTPVKSTVYDLVISLLHAEGARSKTIALLSHVYHKSIHNRFMEARNLLLMSHLQDVIHNADIESRILYNRTLAQLGLCAFRNGHYGASLDCLSELYMYPNRIKELLAQGVTSTRYHERNLEKEKLERMREYPYHMHMNLDMLEAVNLISAMFAEVPNLCKHGKRKVISRSFRKYYDHHKKQAFTGPPESTRHLVMSASDKLAQGDWEQCFKFICSLRMWALMPHAEAVKEKLKKQIQASALQIYLLVYGPQYCSIDVKQLCTMFDMTSRRVHTIVSRMMLRHDLLGAWDQPSGCIIMHNEELSRLQQTAVGFADKVSQYVEMNERLLDLRGTYYKSNDYRGNKHDGKHGHQHGNRRNYHGKPRTNYSRIGQMSRTSRY